MRYARYERTYSPPIDRTIFRITVGNCHIPNVLLNNDTQMAAFKECWKQQNNDKRTDQKDA